jgi:hypothetical protein
MAQFSATDAALEGFQLTREKPRTVLIWAVVMLLANLVATGLALTLGGEALSELSSVGASGGDPDEAVGRLAALAPLYLLLFPLAILFSSVMTAAIYRAVLRPQDGGPSYIRLGGDELRLAGATVLVILLFVGVALLGALLLGATVGGLAAGGNGGAAAGVGLFAFFLFFAALLVVGVKLSLALPATFAERRIRVFESWRLTKGRFWPLLGAYVLAIILALVIYLLAMMIYLAVAALAGGGIGAASSVFQPNYSSLGELVSVPFVIFTLITALVSAVTTAITTAPAMAAYRDITGYERDAAEVFS